MCADSFIGFPVPLLGESNLRLRVYYFQPGMIVIEKPIGVISDIHPWYADTPALMDGLRQQAQDEKPELREYEIEQLRSIYFLESEVSGAAMFSTNRDSTAQFRNLYGSNLIGFCFLLVVEHDPSLADSITCDLPLSPHHTLTQAVVSHNTGKKCETRFRLRERLGKFAIWEARTSYLRLHQIRMHAHEVGLAILGERVYRKVDVPGLGQLKKGHQGVGLEKPLYDGMCVHLERIDWEKAVGDSCVMTIPRPRKLSVVLKQLRKYA